MTKHYEGNLDDGMDESPYSEPKEFSLTRVDTETGEPISTLASLSELEALSLSGRIFEGDLPNDVLRRQKRGVAADAFLGTITMGRSIRQRPPATYVRRIGQESIEEQ